MKESDLLLKNDPTQLLDRQFFHIKMVLSEAQKERDFYKVMIDKIICADLASVKWMKENKDEICQNIDCELHQNNFISNITNIVDKRITES